MRLATITTLTILLLSLAVWAAPNTGGGTSRSGGGGGSALAAVDEQVLFTPSTTTGEAPLAVGFTIQIYGTSLGSATWFYVLCNDDGGNILPNTGIVALQSQNAYSSTYVTDGFCIYESAGAKTARLWYSYRDTAIASVDAGITVTESVGSIDVQLGVEPLVSTETTDIVMTATVTGEAGEATSDTECKFWNDHAAAVAFADVDNDDVDDPVLAPGAGAADTGVAVYADYVGATVGERTAAVACQRNGQEDTAHVPYTILADTITPIAFFASPATGNDPLAGVELEASVTTTCLDTDNITFQFDCLNDAVFEHSSGAIAISTLIDEDGVVTYNTQNDGAFDCANFTPANTYTAALTVDCGTAVQATRTTEVLVKADPTFSFNAYVEPSGGVEPLNDVQVWIDGWGGTATGDVTIDAVNCDTTTGDDFDAGYTVTDPTGAVNLITADATINCDYATDDVYEGDVDATRGTVSFTAYFTVNVTPQPNPPIFQLSETSFNRMALAGEDADDVVFTVGNVGGGNLEWDEDPVGAGESEAWLSCTPDAAVMNATAGPANGESEEITCTITSSTLGTGSYEATVTYTDPAATPTSPDTPVTVYLTVSPVSTPIHLEVDLNLTAGPSPLAVDFSTVEASFGTDYTGSTTHSTSTIDPFADIYYEWDFDDHNNPSGVNCTMNGTSPDPGNLTCRWDAIHTDNGAAANHRQSRNYMTGPLGAHVYEPATFPHTCGVKACEIYYPSLRATDENGNVASWSGTVNVYDPDSTGANGWGDANETACVYENGGAVGTGCPFTCDYTHPVAATNAYCLSHATNDFDALLTDLITTKGYRRILFKGGETWDLNTTYTLANDGPGLIGSYGGSEFIIDITGATLGSIYGMILNASYWRFQDFHMTGTHNASFTRNFDSTDRLTDSLIQRTTIDDDSEFSTVFALSPSHQATGEDSEAHSHIFLVDNNWDDLSGLTDHRGAFVYAAAVGLNILGNYLGDVGDPRVIGSDPRLGGEHVIRIPTGLRILISNNLLGPQGDGRGVINGRDEPMGDMSECSSCVQNSTCAPLCGVPVRHFLVQDNNMIVASGGAGFTCCMSQDGYNPTVSFPSYDIIAERNYITADGGSVYSAWMWAVATSSGYEYRTTIRNNALDQTGTTTIGGQVFMFRGNSDTDFYNNTCYSPHDETGSGTYFACLYDGVGDCYNNVMYAPNKTTHSWRGDPTLPTGGASSACTNESNNFDDGTTANITSNPFYSSPPTARWGFWPDDAQLRGQGIAVPGLFDDALMTCGPRGDAGAMEWTESGDPARPVDGIPGCR